MARKAIPNDHYRLVGSYERLRKLLLDQRDDGRLDRALSYWVLPTDRRLPIAFLDRKLRDLLACPLDELMSTPGVGQKKILGFLDLLMRASKNRANEPTFGLEKPRPARPLAGASLSGFDPSVVSEALWSTWRDTVRRHQFSDQKLGRVAPTLQLLPTVIWHTPLSRYVDLTLAQMRGLRTHGEKRVHAVLEVFCTVHEAISTAALHENLEIDIVPRFVRPMASWLNEVAWRDELPDPYAFHDRVVKPLVTQIRIDLGPQVAGLAETRLSIDGGSPTVKQQAESLGVTRARVYQLLEDCARVMDVRWPEGRWILAPLTNKFGASDADTIGLIHGVRDLFFPEERPTISTSSSHASGDLDE